MLPLFLLLPIVHCTIITVTVAPPIPSTEPSYTKFSHFTSSILNSTNTYRTQHNATSLHWNKTLASFAAKYLKDEHPTCKFAHSGGPYGENIAMGYKNASAVVEAWGDERDEYNFDDQGFSEKTGHFTQLVWKNTTSVGCGRELCGEKGWFTVCEYWPRGNVEGEYDDMVGRRVSRGGRVGLDWWMLVLVLIWVL